MDKPLSQGDQFHLTERSHVTNMIATLSLIFPDQLIQSISLTVLRRSFCPHFPQNSFVDGFSVPQFTQ